MRDLFNSLIRKIKKEKKTVHFLHIGKTGGTALKSVLKRYPETNKFKINTHGHGVNLKKIPKGDLVVFILRDPVSRFISGFYSLQRKGYPRYKSKWNDFEKVVFETFNTPNEIAVALADENSDKHDKAIMAMKEVRHFKRFKKWYISLEYFKKRHKDILFVGFQESLDEDFSKLKNLLGIPDFEELPKDDFSAHRTVGPVDKNIDELGLKALKEWYKKDYQFIEICKKYNVNN